MVIPCRVCRWGISYVLRDVAVHLRSMRIWRPMSPFSFSFFLLHVNTSWFCCQLAVVATALAPLTRAREEAGASKKRVAKAKRELKLKKKEATDVVKKVDSVVAEKSFFKKELESARAEQEKMAKELSEHRLRAEGFTQSVQVRVRTIFEDFRQVYERLGATVHPLELEGENLFDLCTEWLSVETRRLPVVIRGLMTLS